MIYFRTAILVPLCSTRPAARPRLRNGQVLSLPNSNDLPGTDLLIDTLRAQNADDCTPIMSARLGAISPRFSLSPQGEWLSPVPVTEPDLLCSCCGAKMDTTTFNVMFTTRERTYTAAKGKRDAAKSAGAGGEGGGGAPAIGRSQIGGAVSSTADAVSDASYVCLFRTNLTSSYSVGFFFKKSGLQQSGGGSSNEGSWLYDGSGDKNSLRGLGQT